MAEPDVFRGALRGLRARAYGLLNLFIRLFVPRGDRSACLVLKIDALGDLYIWFSSGIVNVAKEARAGGRLSVILVRPELAVFIRGLGLFDDVWPFDVGAFRYDVLYRVRMLGRLRRHGFSRVLQMRLAREYLQEDAITAVVGAQEAISPVGDRSNMTEDEARHGDRLYRPLLHTRPGHELDRNSAAASALSGRPAEIYNLPDQAPPLSKIAEAYCVIAPGAGWDKRKWPATRFAEIAQRMSGLQCVVVGTGGDLPDGALITSAAGGVNLCGALGLPELAALVRHAALVVGNESGVVHMAAYFRVPSVAILGGGHFGWFMPYPEGWSQLSAPLIAVHPMPCFGCNWRCQFKTAEDAPVPCIEAISVDVVWDSIIRLGVLMPRGAV